MVRACPHRYGDIDRAFGLCRHRDLVPIHAYRGYAGIAGRGCYRPVTRPCYRDYTRHEGGPQLQAALVQGYAARCWGYCPAYLFSLDAAVRPLVVCVRGKLHRIGASIGACLRPCNSHLCGVVALKGRGLFFPGIGKPPALAGHSGYCGPRYHPCHIPAAHRAVRPLVVVIQDKNCPILPGTGSAGVPG